MFKKLFTDYKEMVWNPQIEWIKKHKIAYLVIIGLSAIVGFMPMIILKIQDKIEDIRIKKFKKKYLSETNED